MPAHNHADFVGAAIRSVAAQTHPRIELIVIDDGSADETAEVIARSLAGLGRTMRVEFHRQPNRGLGATLARGLMLARGQFVQFLASDDALFPAMTARLAGALAQTGPEVAAVCCDGYVFDGRAGPHLPFSRLHPAPFSRNQHRELMAGNWFPAMGLLYRREILMRAGGIDLDLAYEDWGLLLELTREYRIVQIPDRLFLYRQHGGNASADLARMRRALQALTARFAPMARARDLRAALTARDLRGVLARLTPGTLDLAARFMLRQIQRRMTLSADRAPRAVRHGDTVRIGQGCTVHPTAILEAGTGPLTLGQGCHVGAGVRLVAGPGLIIGASTFIEAGARIGGSEGQTRIGRACLIAARTRIAAGTLLGDMCATMPDSRTGGTYPDGCWILPSAAGHTDTAN